MKQKNHSDQKQILTSDNTPATASVSQPEECMESPMKLAIYLFGVPLLLLLIGCVIMNYFN